MLVVAVLRSPVVADPEVSGICDEIPFPQVKRDAEQSFSPKLNDIVFPMLSSHSQLRSK